MITRESVVAAFLFHGLEVTALAIGMDTVQTGVGPFARLWKYDQSQSAWLDKVGSKVYLSDGE